MAISSECSRRRHRRFPNTNTNTNTNMNEMNRNTKWCSQDGPNDTKIELLTVMPTSRGPGTEKNAENYQKLNGTNVRNALFK
mmetsp:Transcript_13478/g.31712  ORF Transcript_13478/g.31712 Transcript_13478/m.31712 type:complete len:82 (-) Transcript_13478:380-625(-)